MGKIKYRYVDFDEACDEFNEFVDGKRFCRITDAMTTFGVGLKGLEFCILDLYQYGYKNPEKPFILFEGDFPDRMFFRLDDAMRYEDFSDPIFSYYPMCHGKNKVLSSTVGIFYQPMTDEDLNTILKEFEDLDWLNEYDPAVPRIPRRLTKAEEKKYCEDLHINDIVKEFYEQKDEASKS